MYSGSEFRVEAKRILYVDDEESLALLAADLLGDCGAQVVCAVSGQQALDIVRRQPERFDLVVTDESMPGMTGIELAQKLFQLTPRLPVILCSGHLLTMQDEGIDRTNIRAVLAKTDVCCKLPQLLMEILFAEEE